jgi:ribosomal-protein-alanine N-acetyltransferase
MSDLFPDRIETERLRMEPLTRETLPVLEFYEHVRVGAPHIDEITEHVTWSPHETPKVTADFYDTIAEDRRAGDGETYLIRPKDGEEGVGEFAGVTGIGVNWGTDSAELGTWLRKLFWGRGYSGERAAALMEVAFERLDLEAVVVTVHRGNEKSFKAVSRYVEAHGGTHEGLLRNYHADFDGEAVDVHRFSVTSEEYFDAIED